MNQRAAAAANVISRTIPAATHPTYGLRFRGGIPRGSMFVDP